MNISRVQTYGPDGNYLRVSIPTSLLEEVPFKAGGVVSWEVLSPTMAIVKLVR